MRRSYGYDIHGVIQVQSDGWLPELTDFQTRELPLQPTLCVHIGGRPPSVSTSDSLSAASRIHYDEGLGVLGFATDIVVGDRVDVWVSPLLRWSPHVLYTNVVEPILRWTFVRKGYALVHGACLALERRAYLITARTDTGKTTTMLRMLRVMKDDASFVADDLTIVRPDGGVLAYPKPMTISQHTVNAVNQSALTLRERLGMVVQSRVHSRPSRKVALVLGSTKLPMATVNAVIQLLVPPPKYHVQRLIPGVRIADDACLAGVFVIARGGQGEEQLSPDETLRTLFRNSEDAYGFPPYRALEGFLSTMGGDDLRERERQIVREAFRGCSAVLLRSNTMDWSERIPSMMS